MADIIYINVEEGVKRVMNNTKLYAKLLKKFEDDSNFNSMKEALKAGDLQKAQINAHTLKGLAANLSLTELYKQSLEIETQIKAGSVNPDQIAVLEKINEQTLAEVEKVIVQYG
ncbi:MAG: Hpt domain-containing protein [Treponema sp.]|jgi:HPt (histidine-containing phosphotransfer) domain-containing protein|nr:Hpt domain-containing protein [Treponema sp.]